MLPIAPSDGPSPFDPPAPHHRFIEEAELGRGGMGRVFEATDTGLDRQVAIKQSLSHEPALLARFEREVRITAKLQHPGIVPVLDAGRDAQGRPYYVMRRIDGKPLAAAIVAAKTLEARLALVPHVLAAVDACAYAHARGVIHRDIKPWNILVGPFGDTLLIDWGLARELDTTEASTVDSLGGVKPTSNDLTRAGDAYGTPGFMAPEQARGETLDRRADVYALGATLLHVLTGSRPVDAEGTTSLGEVASAPPFAKVPSEFPAELVAIVAKAMSPSPAGRYADAGVLAEDLRRFTTGQLVAAHHYTVRDLLGRWLRRHRIAVGISAFALVMLAAIAVLAVRRVVAARDDADDAAAIAVRRADDVTLEHAESMLTYDPTRAAVLLRSLKSEDPEVWRRVSAILDSALARGVARGRVAHPGSQSSRIAASPSGDLVASVGTDGRVVLHDPELRTPARQLATIPDASQVLWVDAQRLVVHTRRSGSLQLVERDGRVRQVASGISIALEAGDGRVFAIDRKLTLVEIDVGRGVHAAPIEHVMAAHRLPDALVYSTAEELFYQRDGEVAISLGRYGIANLILVSPDHTHLAVGLGDQTIEWDLTSKVPVQSSRWPTDLLGLSYVGDVLFAHEKLRTSWLRRGHPPSSSPINFGAMVARVSGTPCAYMSNAAGRVWQVCEGLVMPLSGRTENITSLARARGRLLGITASGLLFSWDTAATIPQLTRVDHMMSPGAVVEGKVWNQFGEVQAFDLGTHKAVTVVYGELACQGTEYAVGVDLSEGGVMYAVNLKSLEKVKFRDSEWRTNCSRENRAALIDGKRIELRDLARPTKVVDTVEMPFQIKAVQYGGDWLLAASFDGEFARRNLRTGAMTIRRVPEQGFFVIDPRGRVVLIGATEVTLWGIDDSLVQLPITGGVYLNSNPLGAVVTTLDRSLVLIREDGSYRTFHHGTAFPPAVASDAPYAVMAGLDGDVGILDLRDGRIRTMPADLDGALISSDGQTILGWNANYFATWNLPRERTREESISAIDLATNAVIDPTSSRVEFRD